MPESPAVEISQLVKSYGGRRAVDGLSLVAARGQITAVLGPNGAGKTTTMECCEGLRSPDAGSVRVLGLDPASHRAALAPRVGVMLQDGGLPTGARALEALTHVAAMYATPRDVGDLTERLGIAAFARTSVRRLSGGQRQRLALAAALVGRPEVAFLDEPSSGLDPQARNAVWDLVRELRADGVGVVLTTHRMDEAEDLADHVVVVDQGAVLASGSVAELVAGDDGTARFEALPGLDGGALALALAAAAPRSAAPGSGARGSAVVRETEPGSYLVTAAIDPQVLAALMAWCAERGALVRQLTVGRRTLEDVFLDLTGRDLR